MNTGRTTALLLSILFVGNVAFATNQQTSLKPLPVQSPTIVADNTSNKEFDDNVCTMCTQQGLKIVAEALGKIKSLEDYQKAKSDSTFFESVALKGLFGKCAKVGTPSELYRRMAKSQEANPYAAALLMDQAVSLESKNSGPRAISDDAPSFAARQKVLECLHAKLHMIYSGKENVDSTTAAKIANDNKASANDKSLVTFFQNSAKEHYGNKKGELADALEKYEEQHDLPYFHIVGKIREVLTK